MIARVRSVIAAATAAGSISSEPGSTSANRGVGARVQDRVGAGDEGHRRRDRLVTGPRPAAAAAPWRAAVPELKATACRAPVASASPASNSGTRGPVVSQSERSAAATASMSSLVDDLVGVRQQRRPDGRRRRRWRGAPAPVAIRPARSRAPSARPSTRAPARAVARGRPWRPAEQSRARRRVAAQDRDLALRDGCARRGDPRRVRLDRRRQVVDRHVRPGPRVQDWPTTASESSASTTNRAQSVTYRRSRVWVPSP